MSLLEKYFNKNSGNCLYIYIELQNNYFKRILNYSSVIKSFIENIFN